MMKLLLISLVLLSTFGCASDSKIADLAAAHGPDHKVELYSGGKLINSWTSEGAVIGGKSGFRFRDDATQMQITVSGDVIIRSID